MKIEWLNDDCTEARLTKGWFRKRCAIVRRITSDEWSKQSGSTWWWRYVPSGALTDFSAAMEQRRTDALIEQDWHPVSAMPQAKVVRR